MTRRLHLILVFIAGMVALGIGLLGFTQFQPSGHASAQSGASPDSRIAVLPLAEQPSSLTTTSTDALIRRYQAEARQNPRNPTSFTNLAMAYAQKERETADVTYYGLTQEAVDAALHLDPKNYDALSYAAWVALGRHDFLSAVAAAQRAIAVDPHNPDGYATLGDAESNLGNYSAMARAYQRMVDLKPSLAAYNRASYARWLYGDERGAVRFMLLAIRAGSTQPENVAWCQTQLGEDFFNSGFLLGAEAEYKAALQTFPHYARALAGLGTVETALGHPTIAIRHYQQAIAVVPLPQYVTALGDLYTSVGRHSAAQREYALIRFIDQTFAINHVRYGIENAQFDADHDVNLQRALQVAHGEAVVRRDVQTMDTLAWVLYKNGQYREAWKAEKSALRLGTHYAPFYFHAGMIQAKLGHTVEAQSYLHSAIMLNGSFNVLQAPLARAELLRVNALAARVPHASRG